MEAALIAALLLILAWRVPAWLRNRMMGSSLAGSDHAADGNTMHWSGSDGANHHHAFDGDGSPFQDCSGDSGGSDSGNCGGSSSD